MKIKTWRDPYEAGFSPTKPTEIELKEGLTVLVGCNGAGKSTLIHNIAEKLRINNIPHHVYDNLRDGGSSSLQSAFGEGNYDLGVVLFSSSEGECIKLNLGNLSTLFDNFLETGIMNTRRNRISRLFRDSDETISTDVRVLLFDAIDSGLSVDSIVEIRCMCDALLKKAKELGKTLYIIMSANEYELARNTDCFDVNRGIYVRFKDYEDYRSFIIKTRQNKEKRIEKQKEWYAKREEKRLADYNKLVERNTAKIESIRDNAKARGRKLTFSERQRIEDLEREIKNNKPD